VRALLLAGADFSAESNLGHTALGDAVLTGNDEVARALRRAGAKR